MNERITKAAAGVVYVYMILTNSYLFMLFVHNNAPDSFVFTRILPWSLGGLTGLFFAWLMVWVLKEKRNIIYGMALAALCGAGIMVLGGLLRGELLSAGYWKHLVFGAYPGAINGLVASNLFMLIDVPPKGYISKLAFDPRRRNVLRSVIYLGAAAYSAAVSRDYLWAGFMSGYHYSYLDGGVRQSANPAWDIWGVAWGAFVTLIYTRWLFFIRLRRIPRLLAVDECGLKAVALRRIAPEDLRSRIREGTRACPWGSMLGP